MRLKTFHAKSMQDVMQQVRTTLGPDAIIISTEEGPTGVHVTAASETSPTPPPPEFAPEPEQTPLEIERAYLAPTKEFDDAEVKAVLTHHNIPFDTASRFHDVIHSLDAATLNEAFSGALDTMLSFSPLTDATTRPVMLVGPPGSGKTICAAKLIADALLHDRDVTVVSTDTIKAGGVAKLDHFAQLMHQTVQTANTPEELKSVLDKVDNHRNRLILIDSPGTNPFDMQELEGLLHFIKHVDAEPVLVLPAGLDPQDAEEIAGVFAKMGCRRFIATKLDAARRYAGLIAAARPSFLALAALSRSPYIAEGLETASSEGVARLLTSLPRSTRGTNITG